jgi:hypothetical protein
MPSRLLRPRWVAAMIAAAVVATGSLAYAAIPDAGGVIHSCFTKSSGAWRVIDAEAGQACKANEAPLDLYSKGAADLTFLAKNGKASDSDKLDGQDSSAFLGAAAKAADSDKLDGQDSSAFLGATATAADSALLGGRGPSKYVIGLNAGLETDFFALNDKGSSSYISFQADATYAGMSFLVECGTDGTSRVVAQSPRSFSWWWDETYGTASHVGSTYEAQFAIGNGSETHELWTGSSDWTSITTLDLKSHIAGGTCLFGATSVKSFNATPGP